MDGILCPLNKKCRKAKSKEIVENMTNEQNTLETIFNSCLNTNNEDNTKSNVSDT